MASVKDFVSTGNVDEGLFKQAMDACGIERKRGRGGVNIDAKTGAKVMKAYNALLVKITAKAAKVNVDKVCVVDDDEDETPAPKTPKTKAPAKKVKPEPEDDEDDEDQDDDSDEDDEE